MRRACGLSRSPAVYQSLGSSSSASSVSSIWSTTTTTTSTFDLTLKRFATKKTGGASKNGRDSNAKRRGVKAQHTLHVQTGYVIVTQKGNKIHPGWNVGCAKDGTLFALAPGRVWFDEEISQLSARSRKLVHVLPPEEVERRMRLSQSNFSQFYSM